MTIMPGRPLRHDDVAYIAGPMTGLKDWNYPAFMSCEKVLNAVGIASLNPARHPRDPETTPRSTFAIANLFSLLTRASIVVVLPGWEGSRGTIVELLVAGELGLPAYSWTQLLAGKTVMIPTELPDILPVISVPLAVPFPLPPGPVPEEDREHINITADRLIFGDRQDKYSHPLDDFSRIAELWTTRLGCRKDPEAVIGPEDVAWMMADLKWSRMQASPDERDHYVDAAGYIGCSWRIVMESERRAVGTETVTEEAAS